MSITAREIVLKSRPTGTPVPGNFELRERKLPPPGAGQVLVKSLWMSVDPYMRGRMTDRQTYIPPFRIGEPLEGAAVGVVVETAAEGFGTGDLVTHFAGWRDHAVVDGSAAHLIDAAVAPAQAWLGPLGFPGLAAYAGLLRIGEPRQGETVFVSAASGAVGSVVAQIARIKGCRVIGSVGSDEKANWLTEEVGLDAVINYKTAGNLTEALATAAPEGIDLYFDNVGGAHLEAAIDVAKPFARFVLCGMIAQYNDEIRSAGPRNLYAIVEKSLKLEGFISPNHLDLMPAFTRDMSQWIAEGRIKWRETVIGGLEKAPEAFIGIFAGENFGKMLVRLS